jgi:hypothetical protein
MPRSGPEITSGRATPAEPSDDDLADVAQAAMDARKRFVAELVAEGDREAAKGQAALNNFRDRLAADGTLGMISDIQKKAWADAAKAAGAGRK